MNCVGNEMNIIMASDDEYARIMAASINSICKCNIRAELLKVYIIDAGISDINKKYIKNIKKIYNNLEICFIDFERYKDIVEKLVKKTNPPLPLITFARLFIANMIPDDKVLYVDCDTICVGDLEEFWNINLNGKMIAGVQDTVNDEIKKQIGLKPDDPYINAGVILIDLKKWRDNDCVNKAIDYINRNNGYVMHNDQGVLNALFKDDIKIVNLKYNAMTPIFKISRNKIMKYFNLRNYYDENEIRQAIKFPIFVHFVRFTTSRPWEENCSHPMKKLFQDNYEEVFKTDLKLKPYRESKGQRIVYEVLEFCPYFMYRLLIKISALKGK